MTKTEIKPHVKQELALRSSADIILLGGSKGGGKSWTIRIAPLRHIARQGYHAVTFRRSLPKIRASGGLWDKSMELYPKLGGHPNRSERKWEFPSGATIKFWHLSSTDSWTDWQGSEVSMFNFDQLEEFTQTQFLKILGCGRSTCGVKPQILATINPDAKSWLRGVVDWWLAADGYIDLEKNGVIRYFTIVNDEDSNAQFLWVDKDWRDANDQPPKSITFIVSDIWDNPTLLKENPEYLSSLQAQNAVDRERFLGIRGRGGNWNIVESAGLLFRAEWLEVIDKIPSDYRPDPKRSVRFWDLAATVQTYSDPSASVKMTRIGDDEKTAIYYISDVTNDVMTPDAIERKIVGAANMDGRMVSTRWEQERGGSAPIRDSAMRVRSLTGLNAGGILAWGDKIERSKGLSAAAEQGRVKLLKNDRWNSMFLNQLQGFPDQVDHDDMVDAASYAYNYLANYAPVSMGSFKH
jgi:predicted phage terminase large subunit-like protein